MGGGDGRVFLSPERPKIWYVRRRRYLIFYLSYDHVSWYTYYVVLTNLN